MADSLCVSMIRNQLKDLRSRPDPDPFDIAFLTYILESDNPRRLAQDYLAKIMDLPDGSSKRELAKALGWQVASA